MDGARSAGSYGGFDAKRLRRETEPSFKSAADTVLDRPWSDLEGSVSSHARFTLANVFFFSHATFVQAQVIPVLTQPGNSMVVEASTGSGKTLAFLIPVFDRIVRQCDRYVQHAQRPLLSRRIVTVIVSPSRVLSQQTFVVARALSSRYPHGIRAVIGDATLEAADRIAERLAVAARGGGTVLLTTPADLEAIVGAMRAHTTARNAAAATDDQSDEKQAKKRRLDLAATHGSKRDDSTRSEQKDLGASNTALTLPRFASNDDQSPFLLVVDEADAILRSKDGYRLLSSFVKETCANGGSTSCDVALFGATVNSAKECGTFLTDIGLSLPPRHPSSKPAPHDASDGVVGEGEEEERTVEAAPGTTVTTCPDGRRLHWVNVTNDSASIAQLTNRYMIVQPPSLYLERLVHMLNQHPNAKHFIFFRHTDVLVFVERALKALALEGHMNPVLRLSGFFTLHERMSDRQKIDAFEGFLTWRGPAAPTGKGGTAAAASKRQCSAKAYAASMPNSKLQSTPESKRLSNSTGILHGTGAVMLATDLAAYGLDVRDVRYVYHFEAPQHPATFIHRVGRVARMGMTGASVLFLPGSAQRGGAPDHAVVQYIAELQKRHPIDEIDTLVSGHHAAQAPGIAAAHAGEGGKRRPSSHHEQAALMCSGAIGGGFHGGAPIASIIHACIASDPTLSATAKDLAVVMARAPTREAARNDDEDDQEATPNTAAGDDKAVPARAIISESAALAILLSSSHE